MRNHVDSQPSYPYEALWGIQIPYVPPGIKSTKNKGLVVPSWLNKTYQIFYESYLSSS